MTTTAEFIAGFEGYAGRAYWDVNAWRLGYGSDTEGPDQVHVTEGMETTKPRALQNLALRIPQFQQEAIYGKTGMTRDVWDKLTENQKTAITSLVYNYGRLPVVITPSDPKKTSLAIGALRTANGGVNAKRRIQEAGLYLEPDAGWAPQPAPPPPVPQVPAPTVPVPSVPSPAPPVSLPPISSTIAGLDAAILDHFGAILDALTKQRDALNVRIAKIESQAADFAKLEGAEMNLPPLLQKQTASPAATTVASPATPTTTIQIQGTQPMAVINWKTTVSGLIAAAGGIATQFPQFAPYAHLISSLGSAALGFFAADATTGAAPK